MARWLRWLFVREHPVYGPTPPWRCSWCHTVGKQYDPGVGQFRAPGACSNRCSNEMFVAALRMHSAEALP